SSAACDPTGNGEGEGFLGTANVTTDSAGLTGIDSTLPVAPAIGRFITATATDADGNTSEFSQCRNLVAATFSISGRIIDGGGLPVSGVTVRLQGSRASAVTDTSGNYIFNSLPAGVDYTLAPSKPNTS